MCIVIDTSGTTFTQRDDCDVYGSGGKRAAVRLLVSPLPLERKHLQTDVQRDGHLLQPLRRHQRHLPPGS